MGKRNRRNRKAKAAIRKLVLSGQKEMRRYWGKLLYNAIKRGKQ